ncbi:MAG: hypothetical protein K6D97_09070 [Clostridia bacterium]|nr:hypothetical protein [Clostridia bacterium]
MSENKIKEYREKKKISMVQLSKLAGVSKRIYMPFRKRKKKESFIKSYAKNCKCT